MKKLQQELFDLIEAWVRKDWSFIAGLSEENIDAYLEDLKKDIVGMNAVELRQNIKEWKEQDW